MRWIALFTALTFACTTVRVPVAPLGEPADAPGTIAPPMTELWLESDRPVPDAARAQAEQRAHAALQAALGGREISGTAMGARDAVLFVRERAVGVTDSRRTQQTWAKIGLVVGIVVVIAVVVVAVVAGKQKSAPAVSGAHASAAPHVVRAASIPVRPRALPVSPPLPPTIGHATPLPRAYVPRGYAPGWPLFFYFDFYVPPRPLVLLPEGPEEPYYAPDPVGPLTEPPPPDPVAEEEPPAAPVAPPEPPLELPPLSDKVDFPVGDRGFFAGPQTAVQLDLIDRASGRILWSQAVVDDADPLDAKAVKKLVDSALADQPWAR